MNRAAGCIRDPTGRSGRRAARRRSWAWIVLPPLALALSAPTHARSAPAAARDGAGRVAVAPILPTLHEPIPPDPVEDLAMHAAAEGVREGKPSTRTAAGPDAWRAATGGGTRPAPAPDADLAQTDRDAFSPDRDAFSPDRDAFSPDRDAFSPDRDTRRPSTLAYVDPFTPSTAPFKRLWAFDAVDGDFTLYVRSDRLTALSSRPPDAEDQLFYADVSVDLATTGRARLPSVGPGAKLVRAHLTVGGGDREFRVLRDGAENWFVEASPGAAAGRGRFVMEVAIAPSAFAGAFADASWADVPAVPLLPERVAREAAQVTVAIGVNRRMRPRDAVGRLVQFFRGFSDSDAPLPTRGSVYMDLARSRRGVCRHRAFAFLVTAQSLGIPTRFVANEAHAWVEVDDGTGWRRIDLGGAGELADDPGTDPSRPVYHPPPDVYPWPDGARRGDAMIAAARERSGDPTAAGRSGAAHDRTGGLTPAPSALAEATERPRSRGTDGLPGERSFLPDDEPALPRSVIALEILDRDAHRGAALRAHGHIEADGEPCPYATVQLWFETAFERAFESASADRKFLIGTMATDGSGSFGGAIVIPPTLPLGDYDVRARTPGSPRCGAGAN